MQNRTVGIGDGVMVASHNNLECMAPKYAMAPKSAHGTEICRNLAFRDELWRSFGCRGKVQLVLNRLEEQLSVRFGS